MHQVLPVLKNDAFNVQKSKAMQSSGRIVLQIRREEGRRMRFYTEPECEDWLIQRGRKKPGQVGEEIYHVEYPTKPYQLLSLCEWPATNIMFREPVLVWVTEWGIWPSSENWHLYYRLRQTYADQRLLHEAPGHLFLGHESEDFATFLQIAMLNGWGGYVLTQADDVNMFFSHDEWVDFFGATGALLESLRERFPAKT